ncbi:MAG: peroxiredoxin, partial [Spirochaetaceae bacterium]
VVGISEDSEASHAKFMDKYSLPFFLASDPEKTAIQAYGAWGEKKMYGKVYEGIIRSTFIVDEEGMIANVFPKANPKTHAQDVLAAL